MDQSFILQKVHAFVLEHSVGDGSSHDWWHMAGVVGPARQIGRQGDADPSVVEFYAECEGKK